MDANAGFWILMFIVAFSLIAFRARRQRQALPWIYILFFASGFSALIYQIVWQRALFAMYGLSIQSVTLIVSAA
jgi:Kef-type K+ transport system membrane component KefB